MRVERRGSDVVLSPPVRIDGVVRPPGSKSLTNRYLACLALADGISVLKNAAICDDSERMAAGLEALGVATQVDAQRQSITVRGRGGRLTAEQADLDVGAAGTAMRFLTALAALGEGRYRLDGTQRMRERPIKDLADALHDLGASIDYEMTPGCPPIIVNARGLRGGRVDFERPPSSQFISALLMVAPYAFQDVFISIAGELPSRPYVDMTLDVMRALGVETLESEGQRFVIPSSQRYRAGDVEVEPDASGATYLWAAAAMTGGRARVMGLDRSSRQGDVGFVDVLAQMGCTVNEGDRFLEVVGPPAGKLRGVDVDLNAMPDTVQTLAVAALAADGPTNIRNIANLRVKETDRIAALAAELSKLGATVEARDDGLRITPAEQLRAAEIDTYDDHRMAMCFALAGLLTDGVVIRDADCVSKSFPQFFDVFAALDAGA